MKIRKATEKDHLKCMEITNDLTEWFSKTGRKTIKKDLKNLPTYVYEDGDILGFFCLEKKANKTTEIKQLAVERAHHRSGIGSEILKYIETNIAPGELLEVKTLDESCEYEPYKRTRAFYRKNGFTKTKVFKDYQDWEPGNPCGVYTKKNKSN